MGDEPWSQLHLGELPSPLNGQHPTPQLSIIPSHLILSHPEWRDDGVGGFCLHSLEGS